MQRKYLAIFASTIMTAGLPHLAFASDPASDCAALAKVALTSTRLDRAVLEPEQTLQPDPMSALTGGRPIAVAVGQHCLVEGEVDDRDGVGGNYGVRFQLRAPTNWNGRFLFQGGGGMDGFIAPAVGAVPSLGSSAEPALRRGYAVVSMDGGHNGLDASFAQDQQARVDLAYAAIGKVTNVAKQLLVGLYGKSPDRSLFMGCSNGGREAMIAAQRYPTEFDGIVVGNPGFRLSRASVAQAWDVQHLMTVAPERDGARILSQALTEDDLNLVSGAVLKACDAVDGIRDGLVNAYRACSFDLETLRGSLADAKLDALKSIVKGPHNSKGEPLYSDWPVDAGINSAGWRSWKLGTSLTAESDALNIVIGSQSLPKLFMTPPRSDFDVMRVDFDMVAQDIAQMGALNDAEMTHLSTFAERGGKMVMFQGMSDPVFSANDLARWFDRATKDTDGQFARLFMVPGMTHCGGGPALDDFDPLSLLEDWMDSGNPPAQMTATGQSFPKVSQPLCAYPQQTHYVGGDPARITSYVCK